MFLIGRLMLNRYVCWIWFLNSPLKNQGSLKQRVSFFTSYFMIKLKRGWLTFYSTWLNPLIHISKLEGILFYLIVVVFPKGFFVYFLFFAFSIPRELDEIFFLFPSFPPNFWEKCGQGPNWYFIERTFCCCCSSLVG